MHAILPALLKERTARVLIEPLNRSDPGAKAQLISQLSSLYPGASETCVIDAGNMRAFDYSAGAWSTELASMISRARLVIFDSPSMNGVDSVHRLVLQTIAEPLVRADPVDSSSYSYYPLRDDVKFLIIDHKTHYSEPNCIDEASFPTYEL